jgi:tetratricopeptide (TPR) repeat protein
MMWVKTGIARLNIALGNDAAVEKTIDILIADFNGHPELSTAIFILGEEYYNKALKGQPKEYYQKALAVWKRIIEELPKSNSTVTTHAYHFSAECYRRLEQYPKAIEYYQIEVDNWPGYEYAWFAQYKIGACYQEMKVDGTISESEADQKTRFAFQQLLEKYPDCERAQDVKEWLAKHGSAGL